MLIVAGIRIVNIFTVSLFGHREIDNLWELERQLAPVIRELILTKSYVSFLIGRNGEFDEYAASIIKRMRKEVGAENNDITLVLPYTMASIENYAKYYDNVIIPEDIYGAHPKIIITLRNRWMIDQSNCVITCVEHNRGGAYTAMKYAEQLNKEIINIFTKK